MQWQYSDRWQPQPHSCAIVRKHIFRLHFKIMKIARTAQRSFASIRTSEKTAKRNAAKTENRAEAEHSRAEQRREAKK